MIATLKTDPALAGALWAARRTNDDGIALIKNYEGLHLTPYLCPGRILTIGYGHTRTTRPGMKITPAEADDLLAGDLRTAEQAVTQLVTVRLTDNQFAALVSFVFNVGSANFERSTLLKLLNRGWYEQVPAQLLRWDKAAGETLGGLARRRAAEGRLWARADAQDSGPSFSSSQTN